jgi:ABC-type multidrug transport system ATPase subunit/pSer/pThr/pTyr-binding forkhead associated (FHA) protein
LVVRWPGGRSEEHRLSKPVLMLGRAPQNDIVLNYPTVSGQHLRLDVSSGGLQITDLGSTNGTMLRGRRIPSGVPHPVREGEVIRVGDLHGNSVSIVLQGAVEMSTQTYQLGMHRLAHLANVIIGRDPASQVTLDHPTVSRQHAEIVRQNGNHVIRDLGSANGTFVNGQRVGGGWMPLQMGDVIQIGPYKMVYDGQEMGLATSVSRGHRLDALDLGMLVSNGRMILTDISLSVQGGEFVALVGGSGAGKSTLLKAMNGFFPATEGRMLIDGEPLYPNLSTYRMLMGYVPQDDIIHKALPVRRALWYAAKLRLPDATPKEIDARIADVLDMMEMTPHADKPVKVLSGGQRKRVSIGVELLAEPDLLFLDEPTSGLDPGLEKKMMYDLNRLADQGRTIMLVTHATANIEQCDHVAFLDQGYLAYYGPPREAISFFKAQDFADIYLKLSQEVAPDKGKNPPPRLQRHYPQIKARVDEESKKTKRTPYVSAGLLWAQEYRESPLHQKYVEARQPQLEGAGRGNGNHPEPPSPKRSRDSALRQLVLLARRQFDLIRRDVRTLFILLLMMPLIGMLFMAVSNEEDLVGWEMSTERVDERLADDLVNAERGDTAAYTPAKTANTLVMMFGLALTQAGTFGAAYEIVKERPIFKREKSVNLKVTPYVLSKVLVLALFAVIQVASVLLVLGLRVDLGFDPIFDFFPFGAMELFVTLLLAVLASIMLGLFISAVVPTADVVLYVILVQLFVQIILAGPMFPIGDNPASKMVISHWTIDAMGSTVDIPALNEEGRRCVYDINPQTGNEEVMCNEAPLETKDLGLEYEHSEEHLLTAWGALLGQTVLWGIATVIVQKRAKID